MSNLVNCTYYFKLVYLSAIILKRIKTQLQYGGNDTESENSKVLIENE